MEILEWKTLEGPVIQGSRRIVNGFGVTVPCANSEMMGSKDRRNEASALRCFTDNAMAGVSVLRGQTLRLPLGMAKRVDNHLCLVEGTRGKPEEDG